MISLNYLGAGVYYIRRLLFIQTVIRCFTRKACVCGAGLFLHARGVTLHFFFFAQLCTCAFCASVRKFQMDLGVNLNLEICVRLVVFLGLGENV